MPLAAHGVIANVADCGVELDAFTRATRPLPSVRERLASDPFSSELRRLERKLRPVIRTDRADGSAPRYAVAASHDEMHDAVSEEVQLAAAGLGSYPRTAKAAPAWGVSLLLAAGGTALVSGMLLLAAANLLLNAAAWRWGFAITIGGEGLLIGGLAAMAIRLWRNGRRINSQLDGIDRRLAGVEAALSHSQATMSVTTSSLHRTLRRLDRPVVQSC